MRVIVCELFIELCRYLHIMKYESLFDDRIGSAVHANIFRCVRGKNVKNGN